MDVQINVNEVCDRVHVRRRKLLCESGIRLCVIPADPKKRAKIPRRFAIKVSDGGERVLLFYGLELYSSCVFGFRLPDGMRERAAREAVISFLSRMGFGVDAGYRMTASKIKCRLKNACEELGIGWEALIIQAPLVERRADAGLSAAFFLSAAAAVMGTRDPSLSVIFSDRFDGVHVKIIMRFDPEDREADLRCFDAISVDAERRHAFFLLKKVSYGAIAELCVERPDFSLIGLKAGNVYRGRR